LVLIYGNLVNFTSWQESPRIYKAITFEVAVANMEASFFWSSRLSR